MNGMDSSDENKQKLLVKTWVVWRMAASSLMSPIISFIFFKCERIFRGGRQVNKKYINSKWTVIKPVTHMNRFSFQKKDTKKRE